MTVNQDMSIFFDRPQAQSASEQLSSKLGGQATPAALKTLDSYQKPGEGAPEAQLVKSGTRVFEDGTSVTLSGTDGPNPRTGALAGRLVTRDVVARVPVANLGPVEMTAEPGWKPGSVASTTGAALAFTQNDLNARLSMVWERPVFEPASSAQVVRGDLSVGKSPRVAMSVIHTNNKTGPDSLDVRASVSVNQGSNSVTASGRVVFRDGENNDGWGARLAASLNHNQVETFIRADKELLGPGTVIQGGFTFRF